MLPSIASSARRASWTSCHAWLTKARLATTARGSARQGHERASEGEREHDVEIDQNGQRLRSDPAQLPWHLSASVLVERPAQLVRPLSPLEAEMKATLTRIEEEHSLRSDHEMRHILDGKLVLARKKGEILTDELAAVAAGRTAQDDEDDWRKDRQDFEEYMAANIPAPVEDKRSPRRALHRPLRLVVQQMYGGEAIWDLPTATWRQDSEDGGLRLTAERALADCCGGGLRVQMLGRAPFGFYQETFSKRLRAELGARGQKVFIFKALYVSGEVRPQEGAATDYQWLLREEMDELLHFRTAKALDDVILDELLDEQ